MVFVELSGAYWLDPACGGCRWCDALFTAPGERRRGAAGARDGVAGRWGRLRDVMVLFAVVAVAAALLVGVLM